ncbi:hypothetical protein [Bradyrhizobium sp. SSUT77]|uniref:hypothetical protein n=1 Tax=Bradyrhizobium sp. SSUT77 TaxID=3040603 RepID=UPI00244723A3|nr:hypothetical protein [Bradyrhizobium sp. SSUT77]MDH2348378.1 hypothetical protein [Bradyrhizobium sp. SSUT77]
MRDPVGLAPYERDIAPSPNLESDAGSLCTPIGAMADILADNCAMPLEFAHFPREREAMLLEILELGSSG